MKTNSNYQPVELQEFIDYLRYDLCPEQRRALIHLLSAVDHASASAAEQVALDNLLKREMQRFIDRTSPLTQALKTLKGCQEA